MSVIRATSLSGYPRVVAELGGHPAELLRGAGVRPQDVGKHDVFLLATDWPASVTPLRNPTSKFAVALRWWPAP
jgi:hypothetical protein